MRTHILRLTLIGVVVLALLPPSLTAAQDSDPLAGTQWTLDSIDGEPVIPGSTITLEFSPERQDAGEDRRVSGSGGCNGYGGVYSLEGDALTISQIFSTLMACADDAVTTQESAYFLALQATTHYTLEGNRLTLTTADGETLVFMANNALTGTVWTLASIGGEPLVDDSRVTLTFDDNGDISGHGSCNLYGGTYTATDEMLSVEGVVSTRMACLDDAVTAQEATYFAALESAISHRIIENQLTIQTEDGAELVFNAIQTLAGSAWTLVSIGDDAVLESSVITLEFGEDGNVRGNGGCNLFRSSFSADGESLTLAPILSTRRACADPEAQMQENAYFAALEATTGYTFDGDRLVLTTDDGLTLTFAPAAPTAAA